MYDLKLLLTFIQSGNQPPALRQQAVWPWSLHHCHSLGSRTVNTQLFLISHSSSLISYSPQNHPASLITSLADFSSALQETLCKKCWTDRSTLEGKFKRSLQEWLHFRGQRLWNDLKHWNLTSAAHAGKTIKKPKLVTDCQWCTEHFLRYWG